MKDKVKGLVIGIAIGSLLTGATVVAAQDVHVQAIKEKISMFVDGSSKGSTQALIYQGTTYVPARSISESLGKSIGMYDQNLYIGKQPVVKVTEEQAIQLVRKKYKIAESSYLYVEVDSETSTKYTVHVYEVVQDDAETSHTATYGWYDVDKFTGKITSMF
ncbi:hypothetical protein [Paenibacillus shenyangensis]|uniref:hypothetical protein n=1 Tax=Paenibacillus sp. A9 TaxID=1284352 RepID=UPI0003696808|nr:hypothetical protein [Paenibacillus sp. A9]